MWGTCRGTWICINGNMRKRIDALTAWTFDPERRMWSYVESLKDDLLSDDPEVVAKAEQKILSTLEWLTPPAAEVSKRISEQRENIRSQLSKLDLPKHVVEAMVGAVKVERQRGRPRSRNFDAIAGLRLRWFERKEWREIVLEISGSCKARKCPFYCPECGDVFRTTKVGRKGTRRRQEALCSRCHFRLRPPEQKEQVCWKCSDAMADLVGRLERFLKDNVIVQSPQTVIGFARRTRSGYGPTPRRS